MEGTHYATKKKVVTLQRERKITGRSLWGEKYPLSNIMSTFETGSIGPDGAVNHRFSCCRSAAKEKAL